MTMMHDPAAGTAQTSARALPTIPEHVPVSPALRRCDPYLRLHWTDSLTGAVGYLVVHTVRGGLATGGTRMRVGCTLSEVEDLARGMADKTATFDLPVGGAKGGIDFDPKDPRAVDVLARFCEAMRPWLDTHWVTAEDLGVPQHLLDEVFDEIGLGQSYHAAIKRADDPAATLERVRKGLNAAVEGGFLLGDVVGGYGVAHACLAAAVWWGRAPARTTVAIQGVGTMGGAAAYYLHDAGMKITAVADAAGTLHCADGLDIPALLDLRDGYGEIDRSRLPEGIEQLPRAAVLAADVDILVPAAISYAIAPDNSFDVRARIIVEAANAATTPEAEAMLAARGIPVVPDFVANAGAVAWAWWLLLGQVDDTPENSFDRLRTVMHTKVSQLLATWAEQGVTPRESGHRWADDPAPISGPIVIP
ncbi:glutamate dehydrogenase [Nocardia cyriacigeorgica]|uniref:Glutamate dehydrogenase n=1 Tax=Nocardia cyriacigeorgica TaxID=135487 RepID=A0A6P1D176_9NOCA|nr:glutamate dehydrogenase [Nocardia cyriacigeorgica]NEW37727.1 glutamate dehydrogenase [Nocardia cyriacigeorgica]NEW43319.1 glutamate dehydrogenase [Nocardia cyriacigeorgica]NEW48887.1 glutamate dehydrogenase [Nocardia cyriacigeorgica]NEW56109.1 glutamate dehydrogenase [Nocardia cyriacigeorgica]